MKSHYIMKYMKFVMITIVATVVCLVPVTSKSQSSGQWVFNTPGSTTWTVPAGVNKIKIKIWGAGGAGGSGKVVGGISYPGMGGGAGSYAESKIIDVVPGETFLVDIGQGGRSFADSTSREGGFTAVRNGTELLEAGPGSGGVSYLQGDPDGVRSVTVTLSGETRVFPNIPVFKTDTSMAINGGSATDCHGNPTYTYTPVSQWSVINSTQWNIIRTSNFFELGSGQLEGGIRSVHVSGTCTVSYYKVPMFLLTQDVFDFYTEKGVGYKVRLNSIGGTLGGDYINAGSGNIAYNGSDYFEAGSGRSGKPGEQQVYTNTSTRLKASNGGDGPLGELGGRASNTGRATDPSIDAASPSAGGGGAENGLGGWGGNGQVIIQDMSSPGSFIDIGLRVQQGTPIAPDIQHIAIENPSGTPTSSLRIAKNGTVYHVALVEITDANATKARVKLADGSIKALRSCTVSNGCAFVP